MPRPKKKSSSPDQPSSKKPSPPVFKNEAEEAAFWATNDSNNFDLGPEIKVTVAPDAKAKSAAARAERIEQPRSALAQVHARVEPIKQPRSALAQVETVEVAAISEGNPPEKKQEKDGFRKIAEKRFDDYPSAKAAFDEDKAKHAKLIQSGTVKVRIRHRKAIDKYDLCTLSWNGQQV